MIASTLDAFLNSYAISTDARREDVADAVRAIALSALKLRAVISNVGAGAADATVLFGSGNPRTDLESRASVIFFEAMRKVSCAAYAGAVGEAPIALDPSGSLAVAVEPLDGFSNIDINASLGTIFSVMPATGEDVAGNFLQSGNRMLAAGFIVYGPQLSLVLTLGSGTHVFVFSASLGVFVQAWESCAVPERANEYAINASNYRHWHAAVRLYIDDCISGLDGPRQRDFDMRWGASLVAHIYRILMRGGVFLQPADNREGCGNGHLTLVHRANPIAMLVEQAGGRATDTVNPILDIVPDAINQRVPLVCGSSREVERIARYHTEPSNIADRSPLFGKRGLFRA